MDSFAPTGKFQHGLKQHIHCLCHVGNCNPRSELLIHSFRFLAFQNENGFAGWRKGKADQATVNAYKSKSRSDKFEEIYIFFLLSGM